MQFLAQKISELIYILPCSGKGTVSRDNLGFFDIDIGLNTSFSWFKIFISFLIFHKYLLFLRLLTVMRNRLAKLSVYSVNFRLLLNCWRKQISFCHLPVCYSCWKAANIVKPTNKLIFALTGRNYVFNAMKNPIDIQLKKSIHSTCQCQCQIISWRSEFL